MDDYPELSLGSSSSFSESDESLSRKRKFQKNNNINSTTKSCAFSTMSSTPELQLKQNYLSDFHDLQFGRRFNLCGNSTIMKKKSCNNNSMHKHQNLDLELSLSNSDDDDERSSKSSEILEEDLSRKTSSTSNNMVAMGCLKCNLLVMFSKSFPSCPNCKFVNSIPTNHYHHHQSPPRKVAKSLHTLSLLH